ncbi:MAG: glycosyltransferase [Afipia sp.]|nr:glycosyltransferase [Afipia sp.]
MTEENLPSTQHILFVTKKMVMGGAERHLMQILPALKARGFAVELFVLERGGELESELVKAGITISGPLRHSSRARHLFATASELYLRIRAVRPDILHFFLPEPYLIGAIAGIAAGHRTMIMSRRSLAHYQQRHPWLGRMERFLHRRMTVLLGNSQAVVDELVAEAEDRRKIGLIHNGVTVGQLADEGTRAEQRAVLGLPADAFVMVIVANLFHYKGHADLLDALGMIASQLPQPWRLMVVGRDEGEGAQLRVKAERLGIATHILWLGERRDVQDVLAAADASLLVSHQEGFSNALIEAMGQGLPVIATAVGGNVDAIVDGECGLLVGPQDSVALAAAILEIATRPQHRQALGLAARERVLRLFSQEACVGRYERLYRGLSARLNSPVQIVIDGKYLDVSEKN